MIQKVHGWITVIEVIQDMGIEPTKELDWRVGKMMQEWFERTFGAPPIKDNRKKTNGTGTHCFALYPEFFRKVIENFVRLCDIELARQPYLFDLGVPNGVEVELVLPEELV
jgi:hypothetical protein